MRNSEAQKYARWSLAMAGLLAVGVAGVYAHNAWLARQAEKKAPPAVPPMIEQLSNGFAYSKVDGQRTIYTVKASRATQFKEGSRNLLEDVVILVYGKNGDRNDKIITRACDFISDTGKVSCAGEVQISLQAAGDSAASPHAVQVTTSAVTFNRDTGEARTDQPVTFHWPAGQGSAVGMSYDTSNGTLELRQNVELAVSPSDPPNAPSGAPSGAAPADPARILHVAGNSMFFERDTRTVEMDQNVHAQQLTHELTAQKMVLELDPEFQVRSFVASGQPQFRDRMPQGPLALSADEISSAFRTDGSVETIVGTGNVHGMRTTTVGSDSIEAGRLQVDLATNANIPRLLTATKGVLLISTSAAFNEGARHIRSDALEMRFSKDSRPGETLLESVNTLAPAHADWQNVAIVNGKSVPQSAAMAGNRMDLKFDGQNQLEQLVNTGNVEVTRKLGDEPEQVTTSRELLAKFDKTGQWTTMDQTGDVHFHDDLHKGQADHAHLDRAENRITLEGSVVLADATTRTTAQTAWFSQAEHTLHADGHVLTTDSNPSPGNPSSGNPSAGRISNFAPEAAHISAEHLVADTAHGHAVYSGRGRLWQGQSVIEGETIELDSPTHVMQVKGQVRGVFPQAAWNPKTTELSRPVPPKAAKPAPAKTPEKAASQPASPGTQLGHVRGGLLTYWETESRGRVEQNARVDSEQGSIQADAIDLYFSDGGAASGTKQLTRSVASGDVVVRQQDRRGTSERAEYTASEGKFVLSEGKPTVYSSTGDTTTGRQLTFYFADDRIVVDSTDGSKTVTLHQVEK